MTYWLKLALTGMAGTQMTFDVLLDHTGLVRHEQAGRHIALLISRVGACLKKH